MRRRMLWTCSLTVCVFAAVMVGAHAADPVPNQVCVTAGAAPALMADAGASGRVRGTLTPLPETTRVIRHYADGSSGIASTRDDDPDEKLVYSNTYGDFLYAPGTGIPIADDIGSDAVSECGVKRIIFRVNGGVEDGDDEFSVSVSVWDRCPGLRNAVNLFGAGTEFTFDSLEDNIEETHELEVDFRDIGICANGTECLVSHQNCSDSSICEQNLPQLPPTIWLQYRFDSNTAGVIAGNAAELGYSADSYHHVYAPCTSWLGGYPRFPHSSFWSQVSVPGTLDDEDPDYCPTHFLAYRAVSNSGEFWMAPDPTHTLLSDDIELIVSSAGVSGTPQPISCEISAVEIGVIGNAGDFTLDVDLAWPERDDVQDMHQVYEGRGEGSLSVARFLYDEGHFLNTNDQPFYINWLPNMGNVAVPIVGRNQAGNSDVWLGMQDVTDPENPGPWELVRPGSGVPGIAHIAVYCRGDAPTGACCPDQPEQPGRDPICRDDVPVIGCPSARWIMDATCAENKFDPPCGTHQCCMPNGSCNDLTYDDCHALRAPNYDPVLCTTDDDCPGSRTCGILGECVGGSKEQQDCMTDADCNEPGETAGTCMGDVVPGECDLSRGHWAPGTFCGTDPEDECMIFQCYDAEGDCMDGPEDFIFCPNGDSDCPDGRMCYTAPGQLPRCLMRAGCGNLRCCDAVCRRDAYCCNALDGGWDRGCASKANSMADLECLFPPLNDVCWDPEDEDVGAVEIEILDEDTEEACTQISESCEGMAVANNSGAKTYADDPGFCCNKAGLGNLGVGNIWYKFTAVHSSARIHTCSTPSFKQDSLLQIYEAGDDSSPQAACESLEIIGCDDDTPGCGSEGTMSDICVTGLSYGKTYYILLAGSTLAGEDAKGEFVLKVESPCPHSSLPPSGSLCELAQSVSAGTTSFSLQYADLDCPGEDDMPAMMNDIWFEHAASCIGNLDVRTCGLTPADEDPGTTLAVYCAPFGEENCPPDAVASAMNDESELNKTCSIGGQACEDADDCVLGCTGLGILCSSDDDCPGSSTCDLRLQAECSVSGGACFTDAQCTAGYCDGNESESCDTAVFEMRCTEGSVTYCPNGKDDCDYGAECEAYWPSCGWTVDGNETVAVHCIKDDDCEPATCDSDCAPASSVVAPVMLGDICKIRIGGEYGTEPAGDLTIACVPDDCNNNLLPDLFDIADGRSEDCNFNGNPDECDVNPSDPDGDGDRVGGL